MWLAAGLRKLIFLLCGALLTGPSIRTSHCAALCCSYPVLADSPMTGSSHAVGSEAPSSWELVPTGPKALSFATFSVRSTSQQAENLGQKLAGLDTQGSLLVTYICYLGTMSRRIHNLIFPNRVISCRKMFKLPASEAHFTFT